MVVIIFEASTGLRCGITMTPVPSRTRDVVAAIQVKAVRASSQ